MKKIALISFAFMSLTSMSANADTLNAELAQCAQVKDSLARLVCFDDLVKSTKSFTAGEQASTSTPVTQIAPVAVEKTDKEASFGAEHLKKSNIPESERQIVFTVEKLTKDQYGQLRFTFKNGQQWKQTDGSHFRVKEGESVLLIKGMLNSIYLKKNITSSNKKIRVKRLK
ncbi:hypothetical protein [Cognaticolwellia mytili]|uniref:hypothetical protein n=1 Tax=Cognaticolwellia mytili TaxID=1888913 RepID=UPI000A1750AD|nr:hypothetical protein [Cognaticolwellia mytili]